MKVSIFCLVILTAAISLSCKKETVTEYRYKDLNTWKKADEIDGFSKYINNANASNDKAVFVSPYRVIIKKENKVEAYYNLCTLIQKKQILQMTIICFTIKMATGKIWVLPQRMIPIQQG
jgi:hypothetical protein